MKILKKEVLPVRKSRPKSLEPLTAAVPSQNRRRLYRKDFLCYNTKLSQNAKSRFFGLNKQDF